MSAVRRWYPVLALGLLAAVDGLHGFALLVLGPDIARSLGFGPGVIASIAVLAMVTASFGAVGAARLVAGRRRRAAVALTTGGVWSVGSALTAFVTGPWPLASVVAADGAATGAVQAVHPALLADRYAGAAQVRAFAGHRAINAAGVVAAPALVGALSAAGLTWRGVFLVVAAAGLLAVAAACRLRDPAPGPAPSEDRLRPTVLEQARGLLALPTMRRLLAAYAVAGVLLAPLLSYLFFFLEDRWGLDAAGRGAFLAVSGLVTIIAIALFAGLYARRSEQSAAALVDGAWPLLVIAAVALALAVVSPSFGLAVAAFCAALAALGLIDVPLLALLVRLAPGEARAVATALAGVALAAVGGLGGVLLLGGTEQTLGIDGAIAMLAGPALLSALVLRSARATADADVAGAARAETDRAAAAAARAAGLPLPLVALEDVSFAYEEHRALERIDLSIDTGELVAVLGTNGAGKSTLLRLVAGLLLPATGTVRVDGHDIGWLAPERRVRLGIGHVPAEAATFGPLTVRESLTVAALARARGEQARTLADQTLERFALLAARAGVRTQALSGGERRLLALAQALLLEPRILLVDELTRGLAPPAAAAMLERVRALNAAGTTVVLVEQSAERALSLAPRAIFVEAGAIRFDGPSSALAERHDLLRPVFLANEETRALASGGVTAAGHAGTSPAQPGPEASSP